MLFLLAFAAFMRLMLASMLFVLGLLAPSNFPEPVLFPGGPPTCPEKVGDISTFSVQAGRQLTNSDRPRWLHRQNSSSFLWQLRPRLRVRIVHGEVADDDGLKQGVVIFSLNIGNVSIKLTTGNAIVNTPARAHSAPTNMPMYVLGVMSP